MTPWIVAAGAALAVSLIVAVYAGRLLQARAQEIRDTGLAMPLSDRAGPVLDETADEIKARRNRPGSPPYEVGPASVFPGSRAGTATIVRDDGRVMRTDDGGRTWHTGALPRPESEAHAPQSLIEARRAPDEPDLSVADPPAYPCDQGRGR